MRGTESDRIEVAQLDNIWSVSLQPLFTYPSTFASLELLAILTQSVNFRAVNLPLANPSLLPYCACCA